MATKQPSPTIIVHGGAYDIPMDTHEAVLTGCRQAAQAGWAILAHGGSALDAVEAAVRVMEDDPAFDAGVGSVLNTAGQVELDAIIMDGRDLSFGAVAAVQRVRNPVTLARLVMTRSGHAMLVGAGAEAFARECGLLLCPPEELLVGRELERWETWNTTSHAHAQSQSGTTPSDTVGAVALDAASNLAAATSTGGTFNKLPGRVGDSPLVGCGAYADNRSAAASATGLGEALMRIVTSKTACDLVAGGMSAQEAADAAIALLAERTSGTGGLIVLDRQGRAGIAHSTPHIAYATVTAGGETRAGVKYSMER